MNIWLVTKVTLLAGALAVCIWIGWNVNWNAPLTPLVLLKLAGLCFCACFIFGAIRHEWRVWNGLDQWPNPRGRYYDRWLALPHQNNADYYSWLAEQKGWQEPWVSWVRMDK